MVINWDAVVTSAVTVVTVTFLYDRYVKPRQEARKERIGEQLRARRELLERLSDIAQSAGVVMLEPPQEATAAVLANLREQRQHQYGRMQERVQGMFDDVARYAGTYIGLPRDLLIECVCCMQGVLMSARSHRDQARIFHEFAYQLAVIFSSPQWRLVARGQALVKTRRLVADVSCGGGSAHGEAAPDAAAPTR